MQNSREIGFEWSFIFANMPTMVDLMKDGHSGRFHENSSMQITTLAVISPHYASLTNAGEGTKSGTYSTVQYTRGRHELALFASKHQTSPYWSATIRSWTSSPFGPFLSFLVALLSINFNPLLLNQSI